MTINCNYLIGASVPQTYERAAYEGLESLSSLQTWKSHTMGSCHVSGRTLRSRISFPCLSNGFLRYKAEIVVWSAGKELPSSSGRLCRCSVRIMEVAQ
jgi:hypothetical protein